MIDGENFVFATIVFIELGFFEIKNNVLYYNGNIKNPLTNSEISFIIVTKTR
jgi:hypothetical protein